MTLCFYCDVYSESREGCGWFTTVKMATIILWLDILVNITMLMIPYWGI